MSDGILLWLIGAGPQHVTFDRPSLPAAKELAAGVPVRPDAGPGLIALRAVLRHSRLHSVDSLPWTHARAGRRAAEESWRAAEKSWRGAEATDDPMGRAP
ncbi:hypothetical protein [Streptomyces parvus]|uniref:hypothetical protein n=1 Tax=Streptomyces parvus TaxID=66428 RepID=UPI00364114FF